MLHAEDAGADWPGLVIGSGPADTTAPGAAEVERDAGVATGVTDAALKQEPLGSSPLPGPVRGLGHKKPGDPGAEGACQEGSRTSRRRSPKGVVRPPPPSPRPASPTAAAGWG